MENNIEKAQEERLQTVFKEYWFAFFLRGLVGIFFGLVALIWTGITLELLILFFGVYVLLDGILAIIGAVKAIKKHKTWWALLLEGILSIAVAVLAFFWPALTALALLYLIAAWAIVTGLFELVVGFASGWKEAGKWLMGIAGVVSLVFGILLIVFPWEGVMVVVWIIGAYAIIFGIFLIILGLQMRKMAKDIS